MKKIILILILLLVLISCSEDKENSYLDNIKESFKIEYNIKSLNDYNFKLVGYINANYEIYDINNNNLENNILESYEFEKHILSNLSTGEISKLDLFVFYNDKFYKLEEFVKTSKFNEEEFVAGIDSELIIKKEKEEYEILVNYNTSKIINKIKENVLNDENYVVLSKESAFKLLGLNSNDISELSMITSINPKVAGEVIVAYFSNTEEKNNAIKSIELYNNEIFKNREENEYLMNAYENHKFIEMNNYLIFINVSFFSNEVEESFRNYFDNNEL